MLSVTICGCFGNYPWHIWYEADNKNTLDFPAISKIFRRENISYEREDTNRLMGPNGEGISHGSTGKHTLPWKPDYA